MMESKGMAYDDDTVPGEYICPITTMIMQDPVMTTCGHTFERMAILKWFEGRPTCPCDNKRLASLHLSTNFALKATIANYVAQRPILARNDQVKTDFLLSVQLYEEQLARLQEKEELARRQEQHSSQALSSFLHNVNLGQYFQSFMDNGYDSLELCARISISVEELVAMGMKKGHARQFLTALNPNQASSSSSSSFSLSSSLSSEVKGRDAALLPYLSDSLVYLCNISDPRYTAFNNTCVVLKSFDASTGCYHVAMGSSLHAIKRNQFIVKGFPIDEKACHFPETHLECAKFPVALIQPKQLGFGFKPEKNCQTLVFIGPTGSGKSHLINFFLGWMAFESNPSLDSVTKRIEAVTMLAVWPNETLPLQFNIVDTIGMLDSTLSNKEALQLATDGVKQGFSKLHRFVFVLRNGRLNPPEVAAIEQAIEWYSLDDPTRKRHCLVIITHCDNLSSVENGRVLKRYKEHKTVGKLFHRLSIDIGNGRKVYKDNFFCVGLPPLDTMDSELKAIFLQRLVVQRQALISLLGGYNTPQSISPTQSWLEPACTIL
eukprot:gb/GEZN01003136.1/.p1 GENE.gb/GEZN01003136.1/~~gb/GEZN01003136.1/.p1  ORF type:complete len:547 (-),score=63.65 gb/GEZN01003136.1/:477-2117(-)